MKTIKLFTIVVLSIFITNCSNKKKENTVSEENLAQVNVAASIEVSLFERLGGEEGISLIVDDIDQAHLDNEEISHVFMPLKILESLQVCQN